MTPEDVTEHDLRVYQVIGAYLILIDPKIGEYEVVEHYCQYTPGVRFMIHKTFEEIAKRGYPYRLHVIAGGLAIVENTTPVTWRHRLKRWFNDHLR